MIKLSRSQLATLRACDPATVSRAHSDGKFPQLPDKKYDLEDPAVWEWVTAPTVAFALREQKIETKKGQDTSDIVGSALDEELVRENIEWKRKQNRKLDLAHAMSMKELYPADQVAQFIGHFAAGLRTNILPIGNRIARGDTKLRDKIEKEVSKGIKKTLDNVAAQLRQESEKIIKSLEEV